MGAPSFTPAGYGALGDIGSLSWPGEGHILETLGLGSHLGSSESGRIGAQKREKRIFSEVIYKYIYKRAVLKKIEFFQHSLRTASKYRRWLIYLLI